ncbi:Protein CBG25672 [Caenorhabditis briggsae]|uniref:Protein CBG25672 n=1 Tax=Caenorhabditis briggsae TaxID=6238 RepID=B6ILL7_CAEBR|nr:Protein CBG25672 [Caenorhabditis briggsae]CAS00797.1 Protein CBG25672 [Caenorhabditis briggsae]
MHIALDLSVLERMYEKLVEDVVPRDVYDEAQQIVFEKMREISYPEYLRSPMYRELLAKLENEEEGKAVSIYS